jgi:hypothetical protein
MPTTINGLPVKTGAWDDAEDELLAKWQGELGNRCVCDGRLASLLNRCASRGRRRADFFSSTDRARARCAPRAKKNRAVGPLSHTPTLTPPPLPPPPPILHTKNKQTTAGPPSPSASPAAPASSAPSGGATRSTRPSARTSGSRPRTRAWPRWSPSTARRGRRSRAPWSAAPTSSAWAGGAATWTRPSGGRGGRPRRTRP